MIVDITGTWTGTEYTDRRAHMQGLRGDGEGWGGPPITYDVTLTITSQSEYKSFTNGKHVSVVTGDLFRAAYGYTVELIPISGFIDDTGFVKLSYFIGSAFGDLTFNGHLDKRVGYGIISGDWKQTSWSDGLVLHQFGTLSVRHPFVFFDTIIRRRLESAIGDSIPERKFGR